MKFSIISLLLVASTASAAALPHLRRAPAYKPYYPRQAPAAPASLNSTLGTLNTNLQALTASVNSYTGGLLNAAGIASKESTLDSSIKSATTAIQGMQQLSSGDSQNLLASVNTLSPNIQASIQALTAKKSEFQSAGLTGTVSTDVQSLQTDTDALGKALVGIASDDVKPMAQQSLQAIDGTFQQATAAFAAA